MFRVTWAIKAQLVLQVRKVLKGILARWLLEVLLGLKVKRALLVRLVLADRTSRVLLAIRDLKVILALRVPRVCKDILVLWRLAVLLGLKVQQVRLVLVDKI